MMEYRYGNQATAEELAKLDAQCNALPWSDAQYQGSLAQSNLQLYVVHQGQQLIGALLVQQLPDEAEVLNLFTHPEHRRRGLAAQLLQQAQRALPLQERLLLEVRISNQPAIALYQRQGFTILATRKNYYRTDEGGREHALIMEYRP